MTEIARERVQTLVTHWGWPDPTILEDIVALGEEAIPAIQALLTPELREQSLSEDRESAIVFYCFLALSRIPSSETLPILMSFFQLDDDLIDVLPDAIYPYGLTAIDPLLTVAAEESLGWYPRALAAEMAVRLAGGDEATERRIADFLRPIVTGSLARFESLDEEQVDTLCALAGELVDLRDQEARPLLEQALADGRLDTDQFDQEYLEEVYRDGKEHYPLSSRDLLADYRAEYQEHQKTQAAEARLATLEQERSTPTVVLSPKIGRNDPCWCGSGKKYKKCHLAQDEKDKVRL